MAMTKAISRLCLDTATATMTSYNAMTKGEYDYERLWLYNYVQPKLFEFLTVSNERILNID